MKSIICVAHPKIEAQSFRCAAKDGEPAIHNPRPMVMDSGLAAFYLGFARDRHHKMRTSATADVRWRAGMTPHMIRICGSTFYFITGRWPEPPEVLGDA
jgi:hypothetical protein